MIGKLEENLQHLLDCEPCGRDNGRRKAPLTYGVYLFSEQTGVGVEHVYVGRVGLTERARRSGTGYSNLRTRLQAHTRSSSSHNQATFAFRLAVEALADSIADLPTTRAARGTHPPFAKVFSTQKARVNAMEFRWVEILDNFECYLFEPYAAFRLNTRYNSWATS